MTFKLLNQFIFRRTDRNSLKDAVRIEEEFVTKGQVGRYLVDSFPALNYLPSAVAPWKKEAEDLFQHQYNLHMSNLEKGKKNLGWNFTKHILASKEQMSLTEIAFDVGLLADAGLETSTIAMCWFGVARVLYGKQGWIAKAQRILDEVVGRDRLPTFADRPQLAFIDAIYKHMGYSIPAGSIVVGNHFAITREESVFGPNPNDFIPNGWMDKDESISEKDDAAANAKLKDLPQTGFGFGRRVCTGRNIARNSLFIILSRLLWAFNVECAVTSAGESLTLDDLECTEGFATAPQHYNLKLKLRDDKARQLIDETGDNWDVDLAPTLDQIAAKRAG
ncbi:cytochrome p450 [Fusarium sporotrichioides]|uniref:Cytochrome p450 n=1 Tax=Fusarium sporotrichioides TaxID=5514 RepID=A0A395RLC9_FUSSP|nr:cytochrome p450 [Fusarium sporotrichioides]